MAEPLPLCFTCDHGCLDNPLNPDQDCIGAGTQADREAISRLMVSLAQPQQSYGAPQEVPNARIPEAAKHHITRDGR
jgi:hypothetical protein